ncbi:MAG: hypothetical protein HY893_03690 [Deltaproteobacteria bacterium]|nr:hypothetical protein [Deltaproteobacteria bacterium]
MEIEALASRFSKKSWVAHKKNSRVLLREPEVCAECNKVFISLYPLRTCADHEGLDEI